MSVCYQTLINAWTFFREEKPGEAIFAFVLSWKFRYAWSFANIFRTRSFASLFMEQKTSRWFVRWDSFPICHYGMRMGHLSASFVPRRQASKNLRNFRRFPSNRCFFLSIQYSLSSISFPDRIRICSLDVHSWASTNECCSENSDAITMVRLCLWREIGAFRAEKAKRIAPGGCNRNPETNGSS